MCWALNSLRKVISAPPSSIRARTGRVLMNMPMIESAPTIGTPRHPLTDAKTTSFAPLYLLKMIDHADWKHVNSVKPFCVANGLSDPLIPSGRTIFLFP